MRMSNVDADLEDLELRDLGISGGASKVAGRLPRPKEPSGSGSVRAPATSSSSGRPGAGPCPPDVRHLPLELGPVEIIHRAVHAEASWMIDSTLAPIEETLGDRVICRRAMSYGRKICRSGWFTLRHDR
jgi:hypothetical protein